MRREVAISHSMFHVEGRGAIPHSMFRVEGRGTHVDVNVHTTCPKPNQWHEYRNVGLDEWHSLSQTTDSALK